MRPKARLVAPTKRPQILPTPHIMHDILPAPASLQPLHFAELERLRSGAARRVEDEHVCAFGGGAAVELGGRGGGGGGARGEGERGGADCGVLVEGEEFGVGD